MLFMYIIYGVLFGFVFSCCYFLLFYIFIVYFNKYFVFVNGIVVVGVGVGIMFLSLIVDKLIVLYGFRMIFKGLVVLFVCFFLVGLIFFLIDFREGEDKFLKKEVFLKE